MKSNRSMLFWVILILLFASHLVVLSTSRLYPFTDLPNHLATATINRHYDETTNRFSEYYSIDLFPNPNVFHTLFCSARIFPSVEIANKIFFCIYAVLLPLSALFAIMKLGGNRWLSLLSFLCIYNYSVTWGFVGFAFSIPVVLLLFSFTIEYLERGRGAPLAGVAILLASLFFIHILSGLFALLLLVLCLVFSKRNSLERLIGILAAAAPFVFLFVVWWTTEAASYGGEGVRDYLVHYYRADYLKTFVERKSFLYLDNAHLFEGGKGLVAGVFFSLCIIVPAAVLSLRKRADAGGVERGRGDRCVERGRGHRTEMHGRKQYAYAFLSCAIICFLFLPREIPQQSILYQRFSVFLLLSAATLAGLRAVGRSSRLAALFICAVCAAHLALNAWYFVAFNRENRAFTKSMLPDGSSGRILSGLMYEFRFRGNPVYIHFPSYYITWSLGVACTKTVDYRFSIVRRAVPVSRLPRYLEWAGRFEKYDGSYRNVDYLLIRGAGSVSHHTRGFRSIESAGDWTLLRNDAMK